MEENADFDVETVSRTNRLDKVKLDILNRRQEVLNAYKQYTKYQASGHRGRGLDMFKIELGSLYLEVRQMVAREIGNEKKTDKDKSYNTLSEIEKDIESTDEEKVKKAFNYIESLLYKKRITAIDTRETVDTKDIIGMNKKGYY